MAASHAAELLGPIRHLAALPEDKRSEAVHAIVDEARGLVRDFGDTLLGDEAYDRGSRAHAIVLAVKYLIHRCVGHGVDEAELAEELVASGSVEAELASRLAREIASAARAHLVELRARTAEATARISGATLVDLDWRLHMVLATSKLARAHEPVVLLTLHLDEPVGGRRRARSVLVELTADALDELLGRLGEASAAVDGALAWQERRGATR